MQWACPSENTYIQIQPVYCDYCRLVRNPTQWYLMYHCMNDNHLHSLTTVGRPLYPLVALMYDTIEGSFNQRSIAVINDRLLWLTIDCCDRWSIAAINDLLLWSTINCCDQRSIAVIDNRLLWSMIDCCDQRFIAVIDNQSLWSTIDCCDQWSMFTLVDILVPSIFATNGAPY
jgi:hypothetical protein